MTVVFTAAETKTLNRAREILQSVSGLDLARKTGEPLGAMNAGRMDATASVAASAIFQALNTASSGLECPNSRANLHGIGKASVRARI